MGSGGEIEDSFPEHSFLASCLRIGLTTNDLKELTFVDVMKTLINFIEDKKTGYIKATQKDWDKLAGGM